MENAESIAVPFFRRWWFVFITGALVQFLAWCVADVFYVRFALREIERLLFVVPPLVLVANVWLLRPQANWLLLAVWLTLLSTGTAFVLVLYLGVPFHFAIGGRF